MRRFSGYEDVAPAVSPALVVRRTFAALTAHYERYFAGGQVGWIERSEIHLQCARCDGGFRFALSTLRNVAGAKARSSLVTPNRCARRSSATNGSERSEIVAKILHKQWHVQHPSPVGKSDRR